MNKGKVQNNNTIFIVHLPLTVQFFLSTKFSPRCVVLLEGIYGRVGDGILCFLLIICYRAVLKPGRWWNV